jgi:hypothetical protein
LTAEPPSYDDVSMGGASMGSGMSVGGGRKAFSLLRPACMPLKYVAHEPCTLLGSCCHMRRISST